MQVLYSSSEVQSPLVTDIRWDTDEHLMIIGRTNVQLTPAEYRLLFPLRHGSPITYAQLALFAYNCSVDDKVRVMMDKHIDRIRGKIRGTNFYVYCVLGYGYMLLPAV